MQKMRLGKAKNKGTEEKKSIFQTERELRIKAIESARNHKDEKPIKYLLK